MSAMKYCDWCNLCEKAVRFIMPSVTTYKCETGFLKVFLKNNYRLDSQIWGKINFFPLWFRVIIRFDEWWQIT